MVTRRAAVALATWAWVAVGCDMGPAVEQPTVGDPAIEEPAVDGPAAEAPVEDPVVEGPVVDEPSAPVEDPDPPVHAAPDRLLVVFVPTNLARVFGT